MSKQSVIQGANNERAVELPSSPRPESIRRSDKRKWAVTAQMSSLLFVLLLALLHVIDRDVDPSWSFISEYARGPAGWLMTFALLSLALANFSLFMVIRSEQRGVGYRIGLGGFSRYGGGAGI